MKFSMFRLSVQLNMVATAYDLNYAKQPNVYRLIICYAMVTVHMVMSKPSRD